MWMDRESDILGIGAHLYGQGRFRDWIARAGANDGLGLHALK